MKPVTMDAYWGPYKASADITLERARNAQALIMAVNLALSMAEADGVELHLNPHTSLIQGGTHISGEGHGGFRSQDCKIGAPHSTHKDGQGIDLCDPHRELARWSLRNVDRLRDLGIVAMENPRWTPTWCHWQTRPVGSGLFSYVPSNAAPLAAALPEQEVA